LPYGYILSIILAFFPSTWFKIMHPILAAYKENRQLTEQEKKIMDRETLKVLVGLMVVIWGCAIIVQL